MTDYRPTQTLPDDVLVRYLDGEASVDEREWVAKAAPSGPDMRRLFELGEASERFMGLLVEVATPPLPRLRPSRSRARSLRAATVVLLAGAGAVAAMPAGRAAVVSGVEAVGQWIRALPAPVESTGSARVTLSVPVTVTDVTIRVDQPQAEGTLTIQRAAAGVVEVEAFAAADLVVLPDGLRLRNRPTTRGSVTVRVPVALRSIRVLIGDTESVVRLTDEAPTVEISLSDPAAR